MNCTGKRCIMQFDKVDPATCKCVSYCPQATPPMTNGDRIRSMTDEEIAGFLFRTFGKAAWCLDNNCPPEESCVPCWLEWLKQERENLNE